MSSASVEAAKNSCVPTEQNELVAKPERVISTGVNFHLRMLDFRSLRGTNVFLIGNKKVTEQFAEALFTMIHIHVETDHRDGLSMLDYVESTCKHKSELPPLDTCICFTSILDIPKEYRSKGVIICFDEPTYNGRQSLFHTFGSDIMSFSNWNNHQKFILNSYQAFTQLMEGAQSNNSAIVFVPKDIQNDTLKAYMWCPAVIENPTYLLPLKTEPKFPFVDIEAVYLNVDKTIKPQGVDYSVIPVNNLPSSIKSWVNRTYPNTAYVGFGPYRKDLKIWGWNAMPTTNNPDDYYWKSYFSYVEEPKSEEPKPLPVAQDPVQAQLAALTEAITALTKLVAEKLK